jgi:hypothetical protein
MMMNSFFELNEEQKVEDFTSPIALVLLFNFFWKETTKRKNWRRVRKVKFGFALYLLS